MIRKLQTHGPDSVRSADRGTHTPVLIMPVHKAGTHLASPSALRPLPQRVNGFFIKTDWTRCPVQSRPMRN